METELLSISRLAGEMSVSKWPPAPSAISKMASHEIGFQPLIRPLFGWYDKLT